MWVTGSNYAGGLGTLTGIGGGLFVTTPIQVTSITGATNLAAAGAVTAVLAPAMPVAITQQTANRTHLVGLSASFSVTATGTPELEYQWMRDGFTLADGGSFGGTRNAVLTISPVAVGQGGSYTVSISNTYGMTTTAAATLTVSEHAGDINADGIVDESDYATFVACFGMPGLPPNPMGSGVTAQA